MFPFHVAFFLGMIALAFGTALYVWAVRNKGAGVSLAKLVGALVILFSALSTLCTIYYGVRYWRAGYFDGPGAMMQEMNMQNGSMMQGDTQTNEATPRR